MVFWKLKIFQKDGTFYPGTTLSSFSFTVFIKLFLIQKSKFSTSLNHKEGKNSKISDSSGKNIIFIHITNQITLKPSLAQKLNLIFKFSLLKRQINIPLWTNMGKKDEERMEKRFFKVLKHCFKKLRWIQCQFCFARFLKL